MKTHFFQNCKKKIIDMAMKKPIVSYKSLETKNL